MQQLPSTAIPYKRTPDFTEQTVPGALLGRHDTAKDVWAVIHIIEGSLLYRILEPSLEEHRLDPTHPGIVEPQIPHQLQINGAVRFYVQFFKIPQPVKSS